MGRTRLCDCGECKRCRHREYMNEWLRRPGNAEKQRNRVREYRAKNLDVVRAKDRARGFRVYDPEKVRARRHATAAVQNGSLRRQPCESCGAPDAQMHHEDYSQPLEVRWLCSAHHGKLHRVHT